jgi:hypothetical protein
MFKKKRFFGFPIPRPVSRRERVKFPVPHPNTGRGLPARVLHVPNLLPGVNSAGARAANQSAAWLSLCLSVIDI